MIPKRIPVSRLREALAGSSGVDQRFGGRRQVEKIIGNKRDSRGV